MLRAAREREAQPCAMEPAEGACSRRGSRARLYAVVHTNSFDRFPLNASHVRGWVGSSVIQPFLAGKPSLCAGRCTTELQICRLHGRQHKP